RRPARGTPRGRAGDLGPRRSACRAAAQPVREALRGGPRSGGAGYAAFACLLSAMAPTGGVPGQRGKLGVVDAQPGALAMAMVRPATDSPATLPAATTFPNASWLA